MECFSLRRNPHYALFLSSFFTTPKGMHQSLMGSRLIAVYSVCLEILPILEETRSTCPGAKRENASVFRRNLNRQIESVCFYAPMGMLPLGRDLILLLAEEAIL